MKTTSMFRITLAVVILAFTSGNAAATCTSVNPKLWVDKFRLELKEKEPICITVPGQFKIRIKQPADAEVTVNLGDVRVEEKVGGALEIRGTNDPVVNKVKVTVEDAGGTYDPGDEFDFLIEVEGVGVLDPRVRIVDTETLEAYKYLEIDALLQDEYDMSIEQVRDLNPPLRPPEGE